jgi:uncharacterized protein
MGVLSDTHDEIHRTRNAMQVFAAKGAEAIVHCGDIYGPEIIAACSAIPLYFAFGNRDCDLVPALREAAVKHFATCLGWGGQFKLGEKRIAVVHGHLRMDLRPLLDTKPNYVLSGHSHIRGDWLESGVRRINPGALAEADEYSVALLELTTGTVQFLTLP